MKKERFYIIPSHDWEKTEDAVEFSVIDGETRCPVIMPEQVADDCMSREEATVFAEMLNRLYAVQLRYESL